VSKTCWRKATSINGVGKTGYPNKKDWKLDCCHLLYTKIISKCINDLNIRPETLKLLEENVEKASQDVGIATSFWIGL
jgi:hypothetical protein